MSTDTELLAAILAAPDDDGPRLVYADFLTAQGDPRGEFITLQCRLAAARDDEARRKLRIAENKLLAAHEAAWTAGFLSVAKSTPDRRVKVAFHRGFLEEATLPLAALDELPALFAQAPLLRRLRFDAPTMGLGGPRQPPSLAGRLSSPLLSGLRALDLRIAAGGDAAAQQLAAARQLDGLRSLKLEASAWPMPELPDFQFAGPPETHLLTAAGAKALAGAPQLRGLTQLELSLNALGDLGVEAILSGEWQLQSLDLSSNQLTDRALKAIASSPNLGKLTRLVLSGGTWSPAGLATLAASPNLGALESLVLSAGQVNADGLAKFLRALKLPRLTHLALEGNELGDAGAKVIASSAQAQQLRSLELGSNRITQDGVFALADSPNLTTLERLLLNDAWLGKKAVIEHVAASPTLANCKVYVKGTLIGRATKETAKKEVAAKAEAVKKKAAAKSAKKPGAKKKAPGRKK